MHKYIYKYFGESRFFFFTQTQASIQHKKSSSREWIWSVANLTWLFVSVERRKENVKKEKIWSAVERRKLTENFCFLSLALIWFRKMENFDSCFDNFWLFFFTCTYAQLDHCHFSSVVTIEQSSTLYTRRLSLLPLLPFARYSQHIPRLSDTTTREIHVRIR